MIGRRRRGVIGELLRGGRLSYLRGQADGLEYASNMLDAVAADLPVVLERHGVEVVRSDLRLFAGHMRAQVDQARTGLDVAEGRRTPRDAADDSIPV